MRLDTRAFAFAAGITAAVLFTLCALALAIAPGATIAFFGYMVHLDLSALPAALTLGSFVGGLVGWTLGTAITFGLAALIYNRLIGAGAGVGSARPHRAAVQGA